MKKNNKVTLLELVATKTVYAIIIAVYYWMWARRDWHEYYESIQNSVAIFTVLFLLLQASRIKKYKAEIVDEMALVNLKRADSICLKIMAIVSVIVSYTGAMELLNHLQMGYAMMGSLIVISIIRTIIFYVMDKKGV